MQDFRLRELTAYVSRGLGSEIDPRTFARWRSLFGFSRGRGAFYTEEEAQVLIEFGTLVKAQVSCKEAYQIIYQKYGEKTDGA